MESAKDRNANTAYRILVVEPHPLTRVGLVSRIEDEEDLAVCGQAQGVCDAVQLARTEIPDLVVTALSLTHGHGLDLIRRVRARDRRLPVVVCSLHDATLYASRAIKAGACGYVAKSEDPCRLIAAIRQALAGGVWLSPALRLEILGSVYGSVGSAPHHPLAYLSDRELMVFELTGRGVMLRQIAERLHMSVKTAETHRQNIRRKLNLTSAAELARIALAWTLDQSGYGLGAWCVGNTERTPVCTERLTDTRGLASKR